MFPGGLIMQVSFEQTKDDLIAYNLYHSAHSPAIRRQRRTMIAVFVSAALVVAMLLLSFPSSPTPPPGILWVVVAAFLIGAAVLPRSYRRGVIKIVGRMIDEGQNRTLLGRREITISPVDLGAASELRSTTVRWKAVEKVVEDGDYLYIYISALEAIIVPRRAFAGEAPFAAFADAVRKHREAAVEKTQ
jgi:hypothetical protein